jgi:hypothetical protein
MRTLKTTFAMLLLACFSSTAQTRTVEPFTKVIVSPYIQVTLVQGNEESVTINDIKVDESKLHMEVNDQTLRIYLDGAKDIPKYEKDYSNGHKELHPLYRNTTVVATITYRKLTALSLRGEETHLCKSPIDASKFSLAIYGESDVTINELNAREMETTIYGEASLDIKAGSVNEQKYTCYGEGHINSIAITGNTSRIIAFGEADLRINVSDRIKITAFGDAKLHYKGNPDIIKGLHFGELRINRMD